MTQFHIVDLQVSLYSICWYILNSIEHVWQKCSRCIKYYLACRELSVRNCRRVRPNLLIDNVLFLHDNARPHTSIRTREKIALFGWITLPCSLYIPDLVPSNNHLFDPMKEGLRGKHFASDEEVKIAVIKLLKEQLTEFYKAVIYTLIWRWNIAIC